MRVPFLAALAVASAGVGTVLLGACDSPAVPAPGGEVGEAVAALASPAPQKLLADGLPPGMARFHGSGIDQDSTPTCNNPKVSYFGGPVLQSPTIVAVFWTNTVAAAVQTNIGQFYTDVTQSSYWSWLTEYDTVGKSPGTNQAILPGTYGGGFVITPLLCAPGGANCKVSDAQLQAELVRQIQLGVLPAPTLDCTGNVDTLYMVSFPANISLGGPQGAGRSCVNNGFCGYHNTGTYGTSNTPLIYAALMDVFTGPCKNGCGGNALALDNATDLASHELVEAATDADIGLDVQAQYAAPAAWGDNNNQCGEVGDICDDGSPGDTITVSGRSWVVQQIWSQSQGKCTSSGPPTVICSGTTVTGCRQCSCGDDGLSCNGATPFCETTSSNVLYGGCEACTAESANCSSGGTCLQSATPAQDDICSNCVPVTACPGGDDCGSVSNGCGGTLSCGSCTAPQTCGGGSPSNPNQCGCTPLTKCPSTITCGTAPDGCGGTVSCGVCTAPQTCGGGGVAGQCGTACTPKTCAQQGLTCGAAADGCGNTLNCGTCPTGQTCGGGGVAGQCGTVCTPKTCAQQGLSCGAAPDGCGNVLNCGFCTPPTTCGGAGVVGQCGDGICDPLTCAEQGFQCGMAGDGCAGILNCGACPPGQTCGGGGKPNQCAIGCVPVTCAQQGIACGPAGDGCGSELMCGTCPAGETCGGSGVAGQCSECTPLTCAAIGAECGLAKDGCGGTLNCGTCPSDQTCGGGGKPNQCACTPLVSCPTGDVCGNETDGCGGLIVCGTCSSDQVCVEHSCVTGSTTTSSSTSTSTSTTASTSTSASSSSGGGGAGGSTSAQASTGSGEWIPIYGRACAAAPGDAPGGGSAAWLGLGLLGLTGIGARRRRARAGRA